MSSARKTTICAVGYHEKLIQAWDVASQLKAAEFSTLFSSGAGNLVASPDGQVVIVGRCRKRGSVAAYSLVDGSLLWRRDNLVWPSSLTVSFTRDLLFCSVGDEAKRVEAWDIKTGETITVWRRAERFWDGPNGVALLVNSHQGNHQLLGESNRSFPRRSPILNVCFLPDSLCIYEVGAPVRCIGCKDVEERWRFPTRVGEPRTSAVL